VSLKIEKDDIKQTIYQHPEFVQYMADMDKVFSEWETQTTGTLKALQADHHPKEVIFNISESLLSSYTGKALIDRYDVYQHLMNYWFEVMQDDCYLIATDGWTAEIERILVKNKKGKEVDKGWTCDLIPKVLVINRYFADEKQVIDDLKTEQETIESQLAELEEEHSGEEGALSTVGNKTDANIALNEYMELAWSSVNPDTFEIYEQNTTSLKEDITQFINLKEQYAIQNLKNSKGNITQNAIKVRLKQAIDSDEEKLINRYLQNDKSIKELKKTIKELRGNAMTEIEERIANNAEDEYLAEISIIRQYLQLTQDIADIKKAIKAADAKLDADMLDFYPTLTEEQIKQLVVDDKWIATIDKDIHTEMDSISQRLTKRIKELAERYEIPLPQQNQNVVNLENAVNGHLQKMGFVWN